MTQDYRGWHALDLRDVANTSSLRGLFDREDDWSGWGRFTRHGVIAIEGVPFSVPDPEQASGGLNVLALRGGANQAWDCRTSYPQRVEFPVGESVVRVHVLGGVAGWGAPWGERSGEEAVRWTWVYADGVEETVVLRNGVEFADWIGALRRARLDGGRGPGRARRAGAGATFLAGARARGRVCHRARVARHVPLAGVPGLDGRAARRAAGRLRARADLRQARRAAARRRHQPRLQALVRSRGSHAARRVGTERALHRERDRGSGRPAPGLRARVLDQPAPDRGLHGGRRSHAAAGGGVLFLHAGTWSNWPEWQTRANSLLCAQASSHESLGPFEVRRTDAEHALARDLPESFEITDELYRAAPAPGRARYACSRRAARAPAATPGRCCGPWKPDPAEWSPASTPVTRRRRAPPSGLPRAARLGRGVAARTAVSHRIHLGRQPRGPARAAGRARSISSTSIRRSTPASVQTRDAAQDGARRATATAPASAAAATAPSASATAALRRRVRRLPRRSSSRACARRTACSRRTAASTSTSTTARCTTARCCSTRSSAASRFLNEIIWAYDYGARANEALAREARQHPVLREGSRAATSSTSTRSTASRTWRPGWSGRRRRRAASCRPTPGGTRSCSPTGKEKTRLPDAEAARDPAPDRAASSPTGRPGARLLRRQRHDRRGRARARPAASCWSTTTPRRSR